MRPWIGFTLLVACAGRSAVDATATATTRGHGTDSSPADDPLDGPPVADGDDDPVGDTDPSTDRSPRIVVLTGARRAGSGEPVELRIEDGVFTEVGATVDRTDATPTDAGGRFVVPGFIDSHVHLAYLPEAPGMAAGGITGAVDWAAPIGWLAERPTDLRILASGPMITAPGGYPTTSWGRDGYGVECATLADAVRAVDLVVDAGAEVIKLPLAGGPELDEATLAAVVERAHERGVKVGVHALDDSGARRAAVAGADLLVHMPTTALSEDTISTWADRAVVPTLSAFGSSSVARDNLARLRAAGATILYGTDFGNARNVGISVPETQAMVQAGMSPAEVVQAATLGPATYWGWDDLGRLEVGAVGVTVLLETDPTVDGAAWLAGFERWPPLE